MHVRRHQFETPPSEGYENTLVLVMQWIYEAQRPSPLPRHRVRELSPHFSSTIQTVRGKTADLSPNIQPQPEQLQNALLNRLAAEIRVRIWEYALGGQKLHILRKFGKVGHRVCQGQACQDCAQCDFAFNFGTPVASEPSRGTEKSLLSLLLTCHQIYSEAIDILYSSNTFHFPYIWNLSFFQSTILPKRFSAIRSVVLVHYFENHQSGGSGNPFTLFPGPDVSWKSGCDALLAMTGLRKLEIHVRKPEVYSSNISERSIVGVFEELKGLTVGEWIMYVTGTPGWMLDAANMELELRKRGLGVKVVGKPLEADHNSAVM